MSSAPMARRATSQVKVNQTCHLLLFKDSVLPNGTFRESILCIFAPQMREELPHILTPYAPKSRAAMTLEGNQGAEKNYFTNFEGPSNWQVYSWRQILSTQTLGEESEAGGG